MTTLFDYAISNPPYQKPTYATGNNSAENIFHLFYHTSYHTAQKISMIFPGGRWMQRSSRSTIAADTIYPTVKRIDWYYNGMTAADRQLFPTAIIHDGVSVTYSDHRPGGEIVVNGVVFDRPRSDQILPLSPEKAEFARNIHHTYPHFLNTRKHPRTFFGIPSYYAERNKDKIHPITEPPTTPNPIKAYIANTGKGSAKRVTEYWISEDAINWTPQKRLVYSHWKICTSQGSASKDPGKVTYTLAEPNTVIGESWIILGHFPTQQEAENYISYLYTDTVKDLLGESRGGNLRTWGYFVPDLEDYTDNNPHINWNTDLDPQLQELFSSIDEAPDPR